MAKKYATLVINNLMYRFPAARVKSETYALDSDIQLPTKEEFPPTVTPSARNLEVTLELPIDGDPYYKVVREMIRATQFMFAQRDNVISDAAPSGKDEVVLSTENNSTLHLGKNLKIPFTNLEVPWLIQISCAYYGLKTQLSCCILGSFNISNSPKQSNIETWKLTLIEYDLGPLRKKLIEEIKKAKIIKKLGILP